MQAKLSLYADEKGLFFGKWWLFVDKYQGFSGLGARSATTQTYHRGREPNKTMKNTRRGARGLPMKAPAYDLVALATISYQNPSCITYCSYPAAE